MRKYLLLFGLLLLFSCKQAEEKTVDGLDFLFENPQPENDSYLSVFPRKYRGLYMNQDSSFLKIDKNVIIKEWYYKFRIDKEAFDSLKKMYNYSNGKLKDLKTNEEYYVVQKADSLELINKNTETLFRFSDSQKAKYINGFVVLSTKDSIYWQIKLLNLKKDVLKLKYIYSKEDLKRIDSLSSTKVKMIDSSSFVIKVKRKEFKKMINLKQLGDERQYKKVK